MFTSVSMVSYVYYCIQGFLCIHLYPVFPMYTPVSRVSYEYSNIQGFLCILLYPGFPMYTPVSRVSYVYSWTLFLCNIMMLSSVCWRREKAKTNFIVLTQYKYREENISVLQTYLSENWYLYTTLTQYKYREENISVL